MNRCTKLLFLVHTNILVFLFFLPAIAFPANSKSYRLESIKINASIEPDGSLIISEARSFHFQGSYRWADYELPLLNLGTVSDFSLYEDTKEYIESFSETTGTYQLKLTSTRFYVKWYYRARNESRTFVLKYRITNAVTVHQDVAEFYYKFVSADKPKSIGAVDVDLKLPEAADTSQVRAWLHSSINGQYGFASGRLWFLVSPLPHRNFFEVRVILPPEWFPDAQKKSGKFVRSQIFEQEKISVEQMNRLREEARQKILFKQKYKNDVFQAGVILSLLGIVVFFLLFQRFGRAHPVPITGRITSEIPEDISPAVASYIYFTRQIGAGALVSTMLDLARRGYFTFEEQVQQKKFIFPYLKKNYNLKIDRSKYESEKNRLLPYEQDLVDFIFYELAPGRSEIDLAEIRKSRSKVTKWFSNWKKMIKQQWGDQPFYDKQSVKATIYAIVISLLIAAAGIVGAITFAEVAIYPIITGFALLFLSFAILRYTKEVKHLRSKFLGLRRYLTKYEIRKNTENLTTKFEKYFVYGIALGVSASVIKELISTVPDWQTTGYFPWYLSSASHGSPINFANSISSMITATSSTMATASGTGGGAGAGGGGGAGGASGGAG